MKDTSQYKLNSFEQLAKDYLHSKDPLDLEDIAIEPNNSSEFTAFKRQLVRDNPDNSNNLQQFKQLLVN